MLDTGQYDKTDVNKSVPNSIDKIYQHVYGIDQTEITEPTSSSIHCGINQTAKMFLTLTAPLYFFDLNFFFKSYPKKTIPNVYLLFQVLDFLLYSGIYKYCYFSN